MKLIFFFLNCFGKELLTDEGSTTGRSTFHSFLGGTSNSNFGLDEVITNAMHPTASFATNRY